MRGGGGDCTNLHACVNAHCQPCFPKPQLSCASNAPEQLCPSAMKHPGWPLSEFWVSAAFKATDWKFTEQGFKCGGQPEQTHADWAQDRNANHWAAMPSGFSASEPKTRRCLSFVSSALKPEGVSQLFDLSSSSPGTQYCLQTCCQDLLPKADGCSS